MIKVQTQTTSLSLILLASICLYWVLNHFQETKTQATHISTLSKNEEKPSAFLSNSHFIIYDSNGQSSEIKANNAFFYKHTDNIIIDSPIFLSIPDENETLTLTAELGDYHPSEQILMLEGDVQARHRKDKQLIWKLETEAMLLNYKSGLIDTERAVRIETGNHTLTAVGLQGSIESKQINLLSRVRGQYVLNP